MRFRNSGFTSECVLETWVMLVLTTVSYMVPKKGASSVEWQYFGTRQTNDNQMQVVKSTSDLWRLQEATQQIDSIIWRMVVEKKAKQQQSPSATTSHLRQTGIDCWCVFKYNALPKTSRRHIITYHIAKYMVPIYSCKDSFKNMINKLDRRFKIPSCTYFSKVAIPTLYNKIKGEV